MCCVKYSVCQKHLPFFFFYLKTRVPTKRCFHTDRHHVQWWLEFSLVGPLVSAICTAAVEMLIRTESFTATLCGFRQQFQRCYAPSHNILLLWVLKWHQKGSVKDSKPQGHPFSATTPDIVERVRDAMLRRPRHSTRWPAHALRLTLNPLTWRIWWASNNAKQVADGI
jgi:hypothetical protein